MIVSVLNHINATVSFLKYWIYLEKFMEMTLFDDTNYVKYDPLHLGWRESFENFILHHIICSEFSYAVELVVPVDLGVHTHTHGVTQATWQGENPAVWCPYVYTR